MKSRATAALLLIGNELLSGRVRDENFPFLAQQLWDLGVPLLRVEVCPDETSIIAEAISRLTTEHTWVFTSGGIGPTHDDVTLEGIARAFCVPLEPLPVLTRLIEDHFGDQTLPSHRRMACAPQGAVLVGGQGGHWPSVQIRNVIVLPGVPSIFKAKFLDIRDRFRQPPFHRRILAFLVDEAVLASVLRAAADRFPQVAIGSYPEPNQILVTLEGENQNLVEEAFRWIDQATSEILRP